MAKFVDFGLEEEFERREDGHNPSDCEFLPINSGEKIIGDKKAPPASNSNKTEFLGADLQDKSEIFTPKKAIRKKCIDCSGGSLREVRLCWATECPLYPFRMGKNPFRKKRQLSEREKKALASRLPNMK